MTEMKLQELPGASNSLQRARLRAVRFSHLLHGVSRCTLALTAYKVGRWRLDKHCIRPFGKPCKRYDKYMQLKRQTVRAGLNEKEKSSRSAGEM